MIWLEPSCRNLKQGTNHYYDKRARPRKFEVGDEVLLLLPTDHNKLLMNWKGPFPVIAKVGSIDYKIDFGHRVKTFHANLLKKYYRRPETKAEVTSAVETVGLGLTGDCLLCSDRV